MPEKEDDKPNRPREGQRDRPDRKDGRRGGRGGSSEGRGGRGGHGGRGGRGGHSGGERSDRNDRNERGGRGGRGGSRGGHHHHQNQDRDRSEEPREKKQFVPWLGEARPGKGPILDLNKYLEHEVDVQFAGGRHIRGRLTGFDHVLNLVLEDAVETLSEDRSRNLGRLVAVGSSLQSIAPIS